MIKRNSVIASDLRVGILSSLPVKPTRGEDADYIADAEVEEQVEAIEGALVKLGLNFKNFLLVEDIESLVKDLKNYNPDLIINLCEGAFGDSQLEMDVPSLLELMKIPYTGSPPLSLGLCHDKGLTKRILEVEGISTPKYKVLERVEDWSGGIDYPLFVKPLREDASLGITKKSFVRDDLELKKQVEYIIECYKQPVLVEEYISGRELNVAIIGNTETLILPISEILFKSHNEPKIVDYSAKWVKDSQEFMNTVPVCPANLKDQVRTEVERVALRAYATLSCRDYARIDIRLKGETPYILEVNPNPSISLDSGFVNALKAAEIAYEEFVKQIIFFALERKNSFSSK